MNTTEQNILKVVFRNLNAEMFHLICYIIISLTVREKEKNH